MKLPNKLFLAFLLLSAIDYRLSTHCFSQDDTTAKANEHFLAGNKLLEAGNYAEADAEFKKAQELLKAAPQGHIQDPKPQVSAQTTPAPASAEVKAPAQEPKKETSKPQRPQPKKNQPELNIPEDMTPEEAVSFYLRAGELLPRNPSLRYNLAIAYLQTKQYQLAAEAFKKAIQLNSKDKESYYNLGVLYENHLGNKKQALLYYGSYLKLSPMAEDSQKVRLWMRQIKEELKLNE